MHITKYYFLKKRRISILGISILALFGTFGSCTGVNLYSGGTVYGAKGSANTNPTPAYTNLVEVSTKGGLLYHNNYIAGQLGLNSDANLRGVVCSHSVLYMVSWGDSSIAALKSEAKMETVAHVEYEQFGILAGFLYHRFCTIGFGGIKKTRASKSKTVTDEAEDKK